MEIELIQARILSRMMDDCSVSDILEETIVDCEGDKSRAIKLIKEVAKDCL